MQYTAENPLKTLSLGWGVQSWTLAAMAALGEIPKPDYAVHADTTHEMAHTYAHAKKWTPWLEERGVKVRTVVGRGTDLFQVIPAFTLDNKGNTGVLRRQCTHRWKIQAIRRFIRKIVPKPTPECVQTIMGISLDEWQRMRTSDVKFITNSYPLVDLRMSRADCMAWLQSRGLDIPGKSSCTFCPYHNKDYWRTLKRNGGGDWEEAVAVDQAIRNVRPNHTLYVHSEAKPLDEAVRIPEDYGAQQMEMEIPCDSGFCFT